MSEDTTRRPPGGDMGEVLSLLRSIDGHLTAVETRLTALEDKVERRLQDTRPIWEQVLTRLTGVEERLTKVEERLTVVEGELTKLGTRVKRVEDEVFLLRRKFDVWTGDAALLRLKHEDLEERFESSNQTARSSPRRRRPAANGRPERPSRSLPGPPKPRR